MHDSSLVLICGQYTQLNTLGLHIGVSVGLLPLPLVDEAPHWGWCHWVSLGWCVCVCVCVCVSVGLSAVIPSIISVLYYTS